MPINPSKLHGKPLPLEGNNFKLAMEMQELKLHEMLKPLGYPFSKGISYLDVVLAREDTTGNYTFEAMFSAWGQAEQYIKNSTGPNFNTGRNNQTFRIFTFSGGEFREATEVPSFYDREKLNQAEAEA